MATYAKKILGASVEGAGVVVSASSSPGTTIHTAPTAGTSFHEVWLYAINTDVYAHTLTIQWGGTTDPDNVLPILLAPSAGLTLVVPGLLLQGDATPLVVRAYADAANKVVIYGYVNEIV